MVFLMGRTRSEISNIGVFESKYNDKSNIFPKLIMNSKNKLEKIITKRKLSLEKQK